MNTLLSNYYTKSIRLTPDGFSLFKLTENGMALRQDHQTAENVLLTNVAPQFFDFDSQPAQEIDVVVATHVPMLIPDIIYKEEQARDYLRMQHNITHIGQHYCDSLGLYRSLYFLTQNECDTIRVLNCQPKYKSEASLLFAFLQEQGKKDAVLLSMDDKFADIIVMHDNAPALVNRITRMDNVDILYYTLNCVQQFGLSSPTLYVHYFNKTNKKLNDLLSNYHSEVIFLNR